MTGQEGALEGGTRLPLKVFSTQTSGPCWTCTQKERSQRDTTDFFITAPTPTATASAASTMSRPTAVPATRDASQRPPD